MSIGKRPVCAFAGMLLVPGLAGALPLGSSFTYQGQLIQSGAPVSDFYFIAVGPR